MKRKKIKAPEQSKPLSKEPAAALVEAQAQAEPGARPPPSLVLPRPIYFAGAALDAFLAAPRLLLAAPKAMMAAPKVLMAAPKIVGHVGARGARAAFLAGHVAHGSAQVMMAHTLFGLAGATDAAQSLSSRIAAKMVERAGRAESTDAPQSRLGRLIEVGMLAAVEFYPLITSLAAGSTGNHGYAPGLDPLSMPLNDLTISTALKLGGHAHREQADESFGKLNAWRARRAARTAPPAAPDPTAAHPKPPTSP